MAEVWEAPKDPDDVKDYELDWTARLPGDTISGSTWSIAVGTGLVIDSSSHTNTVTKVWLSAGTAGVNYELLNRVETTGGRIYDQTMKLKVRAR
ncbi:hypothetical protein GGQ99_004794 [Aminobacter niigataensis]|uniref:Uncharacterized protein n=1 Tax=Aminobacter niigataensis TaxID=83265 RepID=A0ABR6LAG9_9HYPH|nr:hypothetical protein [Aminobacter niigataensis]MBB4653010.1 hypothetical protein [Aminobacter niigataensis]